MRIWVGTPLPPIVSYANKTSFRPILVGQSDSTFENTTADWFISGGLTQQTSSFGCPAMVTRRLWRIEAEIVSIPECPELENSIYGVYGWTERFNTSWKKKIVYMTYIRTLDRGDGRMAFSHLSTQLRYSLMRCALTCPASVCVRALMPWVPIVRS